MISDSAKGQESDVHTRRAVQKLQALARRVRFVDPDWAETVEAGDENFLFTRVEQMAFLWPVDSGQREGLLVRFWLWSFESCIKQLASRGSRHGRRLVACLDGWDLYFGGEAPTPFPYFIVLEPNSRLAGLDHYDSTEETTLRSWIADAGIDAVSYRVQGRVQYDNVVTYVESAR